MVSLPSNNIVRVSCYHRVDSILRGHPVVSPARAGVTDPQRWEVREIVLDFNNLPEKFFPETALLSSLELCVSFGYSQS